LVIHGAKHATNRQENTAKNCRKGQALSLRRMPEAEPEARPDAGSLVLPPLLAPSRPINFIPLLTLFSGIPMFTVFNM
jgi:hypothetical protein